MSVDSDFLDVIYTNNNKRIVYESYSRSVMNTYAM